MYLSVFILGFISMTAQAVFLREILATFLGSELIIGAALFFWLLWTSLGSGILGRLSGRVFDAERSFHQLLPWYGLLCYAGFFLAGSVPYIARLTPGEHVPLDLQFIAAAFAFMPFNILGGYLFTLAVRMLRSETSPSAGRAYMVEAYGSAAAGIAVSLVLVATFTNSAIALTCPLLTVGTSAAHWIQHRRTTNALSLIHV